MKRFLLALTPLLLLPSPSLAGVIDPQRYAEHFCKLRLMGVDRQEATRAAVQHSLDLSQPDPPKVTRYGVTATQDVLDAVQASMRHCPYI